MDEDQKLELKLKALELAVAAAARVSFESNETTIERAAAFYNFLLG